MMTRRESEGTKRKIVRRTQIVSGRSLWSMRKPFACLQAECAPLLLTVLISARRNDFALSPTN
jgi:hypothetical protein